MAKIKLTKKMKCVNVQQGIGRASVTFASDIEKAQDANGPQNKATAKTVVSFNFINPAEASGFIPDKEYNITISE